MNNGDPIDDDVLQLARGMCDGTIREDELVHLNALLAASEQNRQRYLDYVGIHADLKWRFGGVSHDLPADESALDLPGKSNQVRMRAKRRPIFWREIVELGQDFAQQPLSIVLLVLSLLSGGVLVATFLSINATPRHSPVSRSPIEQAPVAKLPMNGEPPVSVATVSQLNNAAWDISGQPAGDGLTAGKRLRLSSGFAEITFDSQAKVIIEGPIDITISGANGCILDSGKLVAQVPKSARGFAVQTPTLTIVDLGTEFGVQVIKASAPPGRTTSEHVVQSPVVEGSTEVHVLRGEVSITRSMHDRPQAAAISKPTLLTTGQAVRTTAESPQLEPKAADRSKFVCQLRGTAPSDGLIAHWPLNGDGRATIGSDASSIGSATAAPNRRGAANTALAFDCSLQRPPMSVPAGSGLDGLKQGTISMHVKWVGKQRRGGAILARQQPHNRFSDNVLQLSNDDPDSAVVSWMATNIPASQITGRTPVGENRWRHIAVTFGPQKQELFLDGVSDSGAIPGLPNGLHSDPAVHLTIGGWTGDGDSFGHCVIDDVKIFNRELTAEEIKALAADAASQ